MEIPITRRMQLHNSHRTDVAEIEGCSYMNMRLKSLCVQCLGLVLVITSFDSNGFTKVQLRMDKDILQALEALL